MIHHSRINGIESMNVRQRAERNGPGGCIISPFLSVSERSGRKTPSDLCCVNTVSGFGAIFELQKERELLRTEKNCTPTHTLNLKAPPPSVGQKECASHCSLCQCSGDFFQDSLFAKSITHTKKVVEVEKWKERKTMRGLSGPSGNVHWELCTKETKLMGI